MAKISLSAARWLEIQTHFDHVVELDDATRASRLEQIALEDPDLEREIRELLRAANHSDEVLASLERGMLAGSRTVEPIPDQIGSYKILHEIGRGGMGIIYKALDQQLERIVALKFMPRHVSADPRGEARFLTEARAASALDHPNICTIHEAGRADDGRLYIAMAYYEGRTLSSQIDEGPLPVDQCIALAVQISQGLANAHEAGIIHRDIKPSNVMLLGRNEVKLLDFGLAKLAHAVTLTSPGAMMGTAAYMSPEQTRGDDVDHRTDLWSLGVVLYEMLAGERPFRAEHEQAVIYSIRNDAPAPLSSLRPEIPEALARLVLRLLEKDPDARYKDAREVLADLAAIRAGGSLRRPAFSSRSRWMLASAGAALTVLLLSFFTPLGSMLAPREADAVLSAERGSTIQNRRVWAGPGVDGLGGPSPDGRLLVYTDWNTGDLAVRDLQTGTGRTLTNKGSWETQAYAHYSVISRDGQRVAYAWYDDEGEYGLRIIDIDGSDSRELPLRGPVEYVRPYDWSPDGNYILALVYPSDETAHLTLISIEDDSQRILKSMAASTPVKMQFSPDGRSIAFDLPQNRGDTEHDLYQIDAETGEEAILVEHPAHDFLLGWAPDGESLLFASSRSGMTSIWQIPSAGPATFGAPELVRPDIGRISPLGFTNDFTFFYSLKVGGIDAYEAAFDPDSGLLTSPPDLISNRFEGANREPVWSQDGRFIAFRSSRGPSGVGSPVLVIRTVETDDELVLYPALKSFFDIQWLPDSKAVLVDGIAMDGRLGYYLVDTRTGALQLVMPRDQMSDGPWLSHDGKTVFFRVFDPETRASSILRRGLAGGLEEVLYRVEAPAQILGVAPSHDGTRIAFIETNWTEKSSILYLLSSKSDAPRELLRSGVTNDDKQITDLLLNPRWAPDDRMIYFTRRRDSSDVRFQLWRIPAEGGSAQRLRLDVPNIQGGLSFHSSGRRIAFTAGEEKSEIWLMENFHPAAAEFD